MANPGYDPVIQHFSHPHTLELTSFQHSLAPHFCDGCTFPITDWAYACTRCNYDLHIPCSQMFQLFHHPADPHHALHLLAVPAYPNGCFRCNACGRPGTHFSYHCSACGLDIHTVCASLPLSVSSNVHAHPLSLTFPPPYGNHEFSCDICRRLGGNHWLYRCAMCGFDAHVLCAIMSLGQQQQQQASQLRSSMGVSGRVWQGNDVGGSQPQGMNRGGSRGIGRLTNHMITNFVTQMVLQIIFGEDGGSGDGWW